MKANPCVLGAVMLHEALHVVQSMPLQPHGEIDHIDEAVAEIPAHFLGMSFLDGKLVDPTLDAAVRSLMERYLTTWTQSAMEFINTLLQGL